MSSRRRRPGPAALVGMLLDAAIAVYALIVVAVLTGGGFDLGFIRATTASKPALLLILLVPARRALGGDTPLTTWCRAMTAAAQRWLGQVRVPAAVREAAFALLVTRLVAACVAFFANVLLLPERPAGSVVAPVWEKFAATFAVFDSAWYFDIARRGYFYDPEAQSSIAFFPLYPLLIRLFAAPFGGTETAILVGAVAISWTAFGAALIALYQLTERMSGSHEVARRTVLYLAVFPFSFYYSLAYTEALFLLWTVLAVAAATDGRWLRAGLFGALATLTRPNGILISLPLLLLALNGQPCVRMLARRVGALAPVPLALVAYSVYTYGISGLPLGWLDAQRHWDYSIGHMPYRHLLNTLVSIESQGLYGWLAGSDTASIELAYSIVAIVFLVAVPAVVRRYGVALGVYVLVSVVIPLSGNVLVGIGRYASVLFPVFMVAGTMTSARGHQALLIASALFYTLFMVLFIGWYPLH